MASIIRTNGRRIIQFVGSDRKRKTIRLGRMPQRAAEAVKVRVENLVDASITGHVPDSDTARWVANLDDELTRKLANVGLIPKRQVSTLRTFIDAYIAARCDTKASTRLVYGHTRRNLLEYFGEDKPLRDVTPGDADEWRLHLVRQKLADNTVRRRSGIAKQFFTAAVRKGLIERNPFADLKAAVQANVSRMYFITRQEAQDVLNACPNAEWRLLFAMSRFGGLRCPSEHLSLRWQDVNWQRNRITIRSPKTEHHPGGESRQIPLFPELLPYLRDVFEQAEPGTEYVITRYRDTSANLRTQLLRIIRKAGLEAWPKLFQNLRSTRETELAETYPLHVVCAWLGNSQPVAAKHYLQVTDEHFELGAAADSALQNALQHPAALARTEPHEESAQFGKRRTCKDLRDYATVCEETKKVGLGDTGLEPVTSCL